MRGTWLLGLVALGFAFGGCATAVVDEEAAPASFSLVDSVDDIDVMEDVGTNARVRGRFQQTVRYRGFTFEGRRGQELSISLSARGESSGFLTGAVQGRVMVYGPVADPHADVFDELVTDSGLDDEAAVDCDLTGDGHYLIAITTEEEATQAQFDLNVECDSCEKPVEPTKLCDPGRLYVETAVLESQEWRKCEVYLLEPARLPREETLVIGPDVDVMAHYYITDFHNLGWGETKLTIQGRLEMESSEGHPIVFRSNVPGKQWAGIEIQSAGNDLHHFRLKESYEGLRIAGSENRISHAEFTLNGIGMQLREHATNIEISDSVFWDNRIGLNNTYMDGRHMRGRNTHIRIQDTEFKYHDQPVSLRFLEHTVLDNVWVHHNEDGISITNQTGGGAGFQSAPETAVYIVDSAVHDNQFGINLRGHGVIDDSWVANNGTFGIRTWGGWHKVKNSIVEHNSKDCSWGEEGASWTALPNCGGGIITELESHTVLRNNKVRQNALYGIILRGSNRVASRPVNRDPAVLNSIIENNGAGGLMILDAPIISIEFNEIRNNGGSELVLAYSSTSGVCGTSYNRTEGRNELVGCLLRNHRIERNNIRPREDVMAVMHLTLETPELLRMTSAGARIGDNWYEGLTKDQVFAQIELSNYELGWLDLPEPQAGLIREIE